MVEISLQAPTIRGRPCLAESLRGARVAATVGRLHPQLQALMRRCRDGDRVPNLRVLLRSILLAVRPRDCILLEDSVGHPQALPRCGRRGLRRPL